MIEHSPAIEVNHLVKIYRRRNLASQSEREPARAVDDLSFTVTRGEIFGLLGPNGAGKTTTLKILTTLLKPTSGTATILGYDVRTHPFDVRKQILVVVQEHAVDLYLTVLDNFRTFGRFHFLGKKEIELRAETVMEMFELHEYRSHKAIDLSGGLKRRMQVAKMFMVDAPIVFLDEATTGMDTLSKRKTLEALKEEARRGRTIVLTTHVLEEAEELCDSLVILNHGKAIAAGSPNEIKTLSLRLFTLTMIFDSVSKDLSDYLRTIDCMSMDISNHTVQITLRDQTAVLPILTRVQQLQPLQHFEVSGATLEDVFVQLIDPNLSGKSGV